MSFFGMFKKEGREGRRQREEEAKHLKQMEEEAAALLELKKSVSHVLSAMPDYAPHCRDTDLLRFLKAYNNRINDTFIALMKCLQWRSSPFHGAASVDSIVAEMVPNELKKGLVTVPSFRDKCDRPVIIATIRLHDKNTRDLDEAMRYIVYMAESALKQLKGDGDSLTFIVDLAKLTRACLDYEFAKLFIRVFSEYYPNRLGLCLLVSAPLFFEASWRVIRPWIDPETVEKIQFVGDWHEMSQWFDDLSQLPDSLKVESVPGQTLNAMPTSAEAGGKGAGDVDGDDAAAEREELTEREGKGDAQCDSDAHAVRPRRSSWEEDSE